MTKEIDVLGLLREHTVLKLFIALTVVLVFVFILHIFYLYVGKKFIKVDQRHKYSLILAFNVYVYMFLLVFAGAFTYVLLPITFLFAISLITNISNSGLEIMITVCIYVPILILYFVGIGRKKFRARVHAIYGSDMEQEPYLFFIDSTDVFQKGFVQESLSRGPNRRSKPRLCMLGDLYICLGIQYLYLLGLFIFSLVK